MFVVFVVLLYCIMVQNWRVDSWRKFNIKQQPVYQQHKLAKLLDTEAELSKYPALVDFEEIEALKNKLKLVSSGEAFILQGGDCAEAFSALSEQGLKNYLKTFFQMNSVLMCGLKKPVVRIGRIAGQFAKPRSNNTEVIDGVEHLSYRGDIVNGIGLNTRDAEPQRLLEAYFQSSARLNFIRALTKSGFASFDNTQRWTAGFADAVKNARFTQIAQEITEHTKFVKACLAGGEMPHFMKEASFFVSHEALLLNYEQCFTRQNKIDGNFYGLSAHMLWIGDRTRGLNDAHVEFLRGVQNPIGIKVGPGADFAEICEIVKKLNPSNEAGKIILIVRMGKDLIRAKLEALIDEVSSQKLSVIYQSDPMHGNVVKSGNFKTRRFEDILSEIESFISVLKAKGEHPGGIHLEMTGDDVTECTGGGYNAVMDNDLEKRYHTHCDPRLNANQSIELAFMICDLLR